MFSLFLTLSLPLSFSLSLFLSLSFLSFFSPFINPTEFLPSSNFFTSHVTGCLILSFQVFFFDGYPNKYRCIRRSVGLIICHSAGEPTLQFKFFCHVKKIKTLNRRLELIHYDFNIIQFVWKKKASQRTHQLAGHHRTCLIWCPDLLCSCFFVFSLISVSSLATVGGAWYIVLFTFTVTTVYRSAHKHSRWRKIIILSTLLFFFFFVISPTSDVFPPTLRRIDFSPIFSLDLEKKQQQK